LKVFNTLSGKKEDFIPQGNEVKMYVCGVTPYDHSHIGHAMSYVIFDVIRRYMKYKGYKIKYVQNITDIDDKLIERAAKDGSSVDKLAARYTESYFADMDALNVERADFYPRATEEMEKIIEVIHGLIEKGYAYAAGGSVYFRVSSVPDYGKLSHRSTGSMISGCNGEFGREKEHTLDFALWKAAKPGEPWWQSPWGKGRPGWHIECSAMSLKYLGDNLDIHGGGQDLVFPHHENEIAQSESYTGKKPFVRYWLHNGMVQFGEEKMSKSLGNLITIKETLSNHTPDAVRIFILNSHYRSPLTYLEESLEAAEKAAERLLQAAKCRPPIGTEESQIDIDSYHNRFVAAMDDDFNTAKALAVLFDLAREINRSVETGYGASAAQNALVELSGILGLTLSPSMKHVIDRSIMAQVRDSIYNEIGQPMDLQEVKTAEDILDSLIRLRNKLRREKYWEIADMIRNRLDDVGVTLEDNSEGTVAKYKR